MIQTTTSAGIAQNPLFAAVYHDGKGNELKKGDKVDMIIYGIGYSIFEVVIKDGSFNLWNIIDGFYSLSELIQREDAYLELVPSNGS